MPSSSARPAPPAERLPRRGSAVALLALTAGLAACAARRELVVLSEPPGAQVRLDNQIVGWTPYTTSFEAYGTRRVTVYREGYRSTSLLVDLVPPWYGRFPFDFLSEILIPVGWHDRHVVGIRLDQEGGEVTVPDLEALLEQAETLRRATPEGPLRTLPGGTAPPRD